TEFLDGDHTRALITDVDAHGGASILTDEVFAGVLGIVRLPGKTVEQFLHNAVEFANDVLPANSAPLSPSIQRPASRTPRLSMTRLRTCATAPSASTHGRGWRSH
ncbi:MAG: hypothetical protein QOD02_1822, partial [Mycobacterium sp.]|nr:hypothetical protein [Mycobacterium sp.]